MKIDNITVKNRGYVFCQSKFFTAHNTLNDFDVYSFSVGVNKLIGDIDSGGWAISYLISMYDYVQKEALFLPLTANINGKDVILDEFKKYVCYMDIKYPLFATQKTVEQMVESGVIDNHIQMSSKEICNLFCIDPERFQRPLCEVGNEIFKAMAAIGYSHGKQVFCFPWLSRKLYDSFHLNIIQAVDVLAKLKTVVVLPLGEF